MSVSEKINNLSNEELLRGIGANEYRTPTKDTLVRHIRDSDSKNRDAKNHYGNGVSVKGILVNVADKHFLKRFNEKVESGKKWSDSDCIEPANSIGPLDTVNFFHVHTSGAATGSRAGFTYQVLDKDDKLGGTISIAWENPWSHGPAGSNFVYCVKVDKYQDHLQECLDYCAENTYSKIVGSINLQLDDGRLKEFISVSVIADDETTAYLLVAIKTSDMEKAIWEGGL